MIELSASMADVAEVDGLTVTAAVAIGPSVNGVVFSPKSTQLTTVALVLQLTAFPAATAEGDAVKVTELIAVPGVNFHWSPVGWVPPVVTFKLKFTVVPGAAVVDPIESVTC
ncbi:MAG: hypothetical protein WDO18_01930 [Acidobacteriota bacterium]